jgi:hypothetical protein
MTSRQAGDDAVSRTISAVGLDDVSSHQHHIAVIKEQSAAFFTAHPLA